MNLRDYDVSAERAQRLREQCHRLLSPTLGRDTIPAQRVPESHWWSRLLRIAAGTWCCVYLFETIRRAAMVYWS